MAKKPTRKSTKPAPKNGTAKRTRIAPPDGWRDRKLPDDAKIKVLAAANPYRGKRAKRWVYRNGMTVAAAVEAGASRPDVRWDVAKGHIALA